MGTVENAPGQVKEENHKPKLFLSATLHKAILITLMAESSKPFDIDELEKNGLKTFLIEIERVGVVEILKFYKLITSFRLLYFHNTL